MSVGEAAASEMKKLYGMEYRVGTSPQILCKDKFVASVMQVCVCGGGGWGGHPQKITKYSVNPRPFETKLLPSILTALIKLAMSTR